MLITIVKRIYNKWDTLAMDEAYMAWIFTGFLKDLDKIDCILFAFELLCIHFFNRS